MKTQFAMGIVLAVASAAAVARGGGGFSYAEEQFYVSDANRDSFIDREESKASWAQGLFESFDAADINKDGRISFLEFDNFLRLPLCVLKKNCHKNAHS